MISERNSFDLTGKVALIMGGSRGIGESTAKLLAQHGAIVVVASRRYASCEAVAKSIRSDGFDATPIECHVGQLDSIVNTFQNIKTKYGRLDILVNNAATNPYFGPIVDTDLDSFEKVIDVNFKGYFYASVEAVKLMRGNGGGAIVNTASVNALSPAEDQGIYSISKAAVVHMTKAFALECAKYDVRVNALLPGLTRTKFAKALLDNEKVYEDSIKRIPLSRECSPDEQASAVLFFVSDAASYTTGASLVVDGGLTI